MRPSRTDMEDKVKRHKGRVFGLLERIHSLRPGRRGDGINADNKSAAKVVERTESIVPAEHGLVAERGYLLFKWHLFSVPRTIGLGDR